MNLLKTHPIFKESRKMPIQTREYKSLNPETELNLADRLTATAILRPL
jgi:hypothetical protein